MGASAFTGARPTPLKATICYRSALSRGVTSKLALVRFHHLEWTVSHSVCSPSLTTGK